MISSFQKESTINLPIVEDVSKNAYPLETYPNLGPFILNAEEDLNGDGKKEIINLKTSGSYDLGFTLTVNDIAISSQLTTAIDGFIIVNLDKKDTFKEIAVHTPGPSNDDEFSIYFYNGKILYEVSRLSRWPFFPSNGIVYVSSWMGFWEKRDVYMLNPTKHILILHPQELYNTGLQYAETTMTLPLHFERNDTSPIVMNVVTGSSIRILTADLSPTQCPQLSHDAWGQYGCDWYLLSTKIGILGWVRLYELLDKVQGLTMAD